MFIKIPEIPKMSEMKMPEFSKLSELSEIPVSKIPQVEKTVFGGTLRTGAYLVSIVSLVFGVVGVYTTYSALLYTFNSFDDYYSPNDEVSFRDAFRAKVEHLKSDGGDFILIVLWTTLSALCLAGVHKGIPRLLSPWLIFSAVAIIYLFGNAFYLAFYSYGINGIVFRMLCFTCVLTYGFDVVFSHYEQMKKGRINNNNLSHQVLTQETITNDALIKPTDSCIA